MWCLKQMIHIFKIKKKVNEQIHESEQFIVHPSDEEFTIKVYNDTLNVFENNKNIVQNKKMEQIVNNINNIIK